MRGNLGGINREYSGYEINLEQRGKGWEGIGWELIVIMYQTEVRVVQGSSIGKQKGSIGA